LRVHNLYLNMNRIVHPCAQPEEEPPHHNKEDMFANMGALVDQVVLVVRLHAILYIALEGMAPRTKIKQKRTRRFYLAREMAEAVNPQRELSVHHPMAAGTPEPWDHTVVTP
jgi:5'-3' exonuclease